MKNIIAILFIWVALAVGQSTSLNYRLSGSMQSSSFSTSNSYKLSGTFASYASSLPLTSTSYQLYTTNSYLAGQILPISEEKYFPQNFSVSQNYPNPFNPSTSIEIYFHRFTKDLRVNIHSVLGEVARSYHYPSCEIGTYTLTWDGKDMNNKPVSSGIYLAHINADNQNFVIKMVLIR